MSVSSDQSAIWVSMSALRIIILNAARYGGHIREHCEYAGISVDQLYRDDLTANLRQSSRVWEYCRERADLTMALQIGYNSSTLSIGTFGLLLHASPDALTALQECARLINSFTTTNYTTCEEQDDKVIFRVAVAEAWEQLSPETSLWNVAFSCVSTLRTLELATGQPLRPLEVRFQYKRPSGNIDFRTYLKTDPTFGHPFSCMIWKKKDLLAPILSHNPGLFELAKNILEQGLHQRKTAATFTYETRRVVLQHFSMLRPRLDDVADLLHLTPRSLQRRLQEEGASFQNIVDEVKSELAVGMLKKGETSVNEVAYQLGYNDPGVFRRAFKKWTGLSPKACRADESSIGFLKY